MLLNRSPQSDFVSYPMRLEPFFSPRHWGGDRLATELGKPAPPGTGESWELSDHPNGRSKIADGPYAGKLFGDLVRAFPREMCGIETAPERFPLLVKYIDAEKNLSIQVHPSDAQAKPGERGKTECWYIMACEPDAKILCGLEPGTTREQLRDAAGSSRLEAIVAYREIHPGSFIYMPAGTVHAILGGTLLCEIQQSSDATYRLWAWGDDVPLHIEDAVAVSRCGEDPDVRIVETAILHGEHELARNPFFHVRLIAWAPGETAPEWVLDNRHGIILSVVAGGGTAVFNDGIPELTKCELRLGDTFFLPRGIHTARIQAGGQGLRVLVSRALEFEQAPR